MPRSDGSDVPQTGAATAGSPRKIGYARVSTAEQRLDLQLDALRAAGCDPIYADHGISSIRRRPELEKALAALCPGDMLVVWQLDRLGRSMHDLLAKVSYIRERGCHITCTAEPIDTTSPMGECFFHISAAFAHLERRIISERTKAGLEAARARGQRLGRPKKGHKPIRRISKRLRKGALLTSFARAG